MEDKLDKIIQKEIKKLVKESTLTKTLTSVKPIVIHKTVGETAINEMARINKNENGKCIFPYDKFEVKMWSFDHNPPHFHVICEGWNISYKVEDGSLLNIVRVLAVTNDDVLRAFQGKAKDFEDCLMATCAKSNQCDAIVTRNAKDFLNFGIRLYSPEELLSLYEKKDKPIK